MYLAVLLSVLLIPRDVVGLVDFVKYPVRQSTSTSPIWKHVEIKRQKSSYVMTGNLVILENPQDFYSVHTPAPYESSCPRRTKTSNSSDFYGCAVATNGGFFITQEPTSNYCLGNIVSNGQIIQYNANSSDSSSYRFGNNHEKIFNGGENIISLVSNFGITNDGNYVIGFLEDEQVDSLNFKQLISGVVWLVRNGADFVNKSCELEKVGEHFITLTAPRNAVGHNKDGNLMLFQIDGNERRKEGPGLHEFAELMISYGAVNAINLDGGGSTTMVVNERICSNCTDVCTPEEKKNHCPNGDYCERSVTTINCITNT